MISPRLVVSRYPASVELPVSPRATKSVLIVSPRVTDAYGWKLALALEITPASASVSIAPQRSPRVLLTSVKTVPLQLLTTYHPIFAAIFASSARVILSPR